MFSLQIRSYKIIFEMKKKYMIVIMINDQMLHQSIISGGRFTTQLFVSSFRGSKFLPKI